MYGTLEIVGVIIIIIIISRVMAHHSQGPPQRRRLVEDPDGRMRRLHYPDQSYVTL